MLRWYFMNYEYIENLVLKSKNGDTLSKEKLTNELLPLILNILKRTYLHGYNIQNKCYRILFKCISLYKFKNHRFVAYGAKCIRNSINVLIKPTIIR